VIYGPGEYEVAGIFITGVRTYHDDKQGQERGVNTVYVVEFDDLILCHLGALGHIPTQEQIEELGELADIDVLLVPVGGRTVLTGARAAEVVALLEPRIVIPMHYKVLGLHTEGETASRFLREMAIEQPQTVDVLRMTKTQLPEQTTVVLLDVAS
ncbi:MAG: MBL fold metallo-hydrolase, partial [Chloroflexi bacterium]|nr:MBL fold metallo-hydrolase [Chloroflexota bacterium]